MAVLSNSQVAEKISVPANSRKISRAKKHELRIRLHTEPILDEADQTGAHREFLAWADGLLQERTKQERFRQLFTRPVATNDLADKIFQEFPRVLQSYNRFVKHTFSNEALEGDFKQFLEEISFDDFWNTDGMDALKKYINAFIVCDLPTLQITPRPSPYFYMLHIDDVIDVEVDERGDVEYIIFYQDISVAEQLIDAAGNATYDFKAAAFDDKYVRILYHDVKTGLWIQHNNEIPHNQPYCPVCKFYPEFVTRDNPVNSISPITNSLGALDDLLFWKISVKYYQTYGMFPIYWGYKQKCTYVDQQVQGECNGSGQVVWTTMSEDTGMSVYHTRPCPACSARKLLGPGSYIEVDPPTMNTDADLREPVGYVGVDVAALQFVEDKLSTTEARILFNTTGASPTDAQAAKAINELQVQSTYESRKAVLLGIKKNFERSMQFVYECLARYRYGDRFIQSTVDLGTQWFLQSVDELNKDYKDSKDAGRPGFELAMKREFIYLTAYHNNPEELQRLNLLQNLEPYQDYTLQELFNMGFYKADKTGFIIKSNFYTFIKRFEREVQASLLQFGSLLSFETRILLIYNKLKSYADEYDIFEDAGAQKGNETGSGGRPNPKAA